MTVVKNTGAVSTHGGWDSIDWDKAHCEVMKLQVRIAKATKQKRWGKVKSLQWILTHSFYAKCRAVKRITTNQGKKTPGVDGVVLAKDSDKYRMVLSMPRRGYQPQPLRRIYIPKKGTGNKKRPLGIPVIRDRAYQALHTLALEPIAETTADHSSFGFRQKRGATDATERIHRATCRKLDPQWILEGDIKGCFDNISHEWLSKNVVMDKAILNKWLKSGFMEKGQLFSTEQGTPQGGIISPSLANIVLDGMEELLDREFGSHQNHSGRTLHQRSKMCRANRVRLCRYADDFIITGNSKELLEEKVKPLVAAFLRQRGLELSEEKTKITHTTEGFDFLGQHIRRYKLLNKKRKSIMLSKPSKSNVHKFLTEIRGVIKKMATAKQEKLIRKLNPKIRGWGYYHRHAASKETFNKVRHEIWAALWRWAKRRHPNKSLGWIRQKYFHTINGVQWVFACKVEDALGYSKMLQTTNIASIRIVRTLPMKLAANPFDPDWDPYFERRESYKMNLNRQGKETLSALLKTQEEKCTHCGEPLPKKGQRGIILYKKGRLKGGKPILDNLKLLHAKCHEECHQKKSLLPVGTPCMSPL